MIRKALAAVISAAVVVSACLVPAFRSTAVTTLVPDSNDAGMDADGNIQSSGIQVIGNNVGDLWGICYPATYDSIVADKLAKTITFKNFVADGYEGYGELFPGSGADGYTFIFDGESKIRTFCFEDTLPNGITISLTPGSTLIASGWFALCNPYIKLASGTTADPSSLAEGSTITFTGNLGSDDNYGLTPEMIEEILKRINEIIYEEDLMEFENALNAAALNATAANPQVLYFNHGDALPRDLMRTLSSNPNLNVVFHYRYGDKVYQLWINGAQAARFFNEDTKWYGPEWLAAHFPADTSGLFEFEK